MAVEQVLLIVCAVAILLYILWRVDLHIEQKDKLQLEEYDKQRLSAKAVVKEQSEFEQRLEANVDLPDGIRWSVAFIYRYLMRKWFTSLLASSRYTGGSDKLKSDWLEYMYLLERRETLNFLSLESSDEDKRDKYGQEAEEARRKLKVIEDAMAAAIGQEAIEQLETARSAPHDAFDRSGKKPVASAGYHYFPTSIRPYVEELVPRDKELFPEYMRTKGLLAKSEMQRPGSTTEI
jgi:hypothetical protein